MRSSISFRSQIAGLEERHKLLLVPYLVSGQSPDQKLFSVNFMTRSGSGQMYFSEFYDI